MLKNLLPVVIEFLSELEPRIQLLHVSVLLFALQLFQLLQPIHLLLLVKRKQ